MTASALPMLSVFAYIGARATALADLANCLGVLPANVICHAEEKVDNSFYARQESSVRYSAVAGDFLFSCDIDLSGVTQKVNKAGPCDMAGSDQDF